MNKQRPENSVTEMKMNWMLVSEWANQKLMQCKKCTTNTVKPAHDAAMESPEYKYAYQSNKAFTMEWSHGHWPWPVWYLCHPFTWTNEMTDHMLAAKMRVRHSRVTSAGSKWIKEFVSKTIPWSLSWQVLTAHNTQAHQISTKVNGASNEVAMIPWFYEVPQ
jgi:hypothetical protein